MLEFWSHFKSPCVPVCAYRRWKFQFAVAFGPAFLCLQRYTGNLDVVSEHLLCLSFQLWISFLVFRVYLSASIGCNPDYPIPLLTATSTLRTRWHNLFLCCFWTLKVLLAIFFFFSLSGFICHLNRTQQFQFYSRLYRNAKENPTKGTI